MKIILIFSVSTLVILFLAFFRYKPKKSHEIYDIVIAHRGLHGIQYKENSLEAYTQAILNNMAIEIDIRFLKKDFEIICYHDRYAIKIRKLKRIKDCNYNELEASAKLVNLHIPKLSETLELIDGKVPLLIEIKDYLTKDYLKCLLDNLYSYQQKYNDKLYFHTKNIFTYHRARKIWGSKVFLVINLFRKRFNFRKYGGVWHKKEKANNLK